MPKDLTFKQVCDFIKKDNPDLIGDIDNLLGLALACSPLFIGAGSVSLLPMIPVKNEIVKVGKRVFEGLTSKKDDDYLVRWQRMEMAYGLICVTAFSEALEIQIPEPLYGKFELLKRKNISREEFWGKNFCRSEISSGEPTMTAIANSLAALTTQFPHPVETLDHQIKRNAELWDKMAKDFREFVQNSAFWETSTEDEQKQILVWIEKIPQIAADCFKAQYFELARRYEDFAVWANLHEHEETQMLIASLSEYVQQQAALSKESKTIIDIGFARMHNAVLSIPETLIIRKATDIANDIKRYYEKEVFEPIAEGVEPQGNKPCIRFPRICDAFIPQSFRVLRWESKLKSLEDEATWAGLERREDLEAFLLNYLSSPFSTEAPLVILGHPGSGKSLLTKVLSAQLMSNQYTVIRVPLREVNADARIAEQIVERINQVTNRSIHWGDFSGAFINNPPLVILDGYDELLQASGKVFSMYLKDVMDFQEREATLGRPIRVIVTSRITLIDKATIPPSATIIRLLEFDKRQRDKWISIWNQENSSYFKESKIEEFALPVENNDGAAKILVLAEQPLLLLMLALYDSESNQLRESKMLDRTILYDRLLRRFVEREKAKDRKFMELEAFARKREIDVEMKRLAVAALGMYNRRKLHILSTELNEDIKFFNLIPSEHSVSSRGGRLLAPADLLLGSFFFVHKSNAQIKAGSFEHHEKTAAFEFLHNTFGEFLTAEFIIQQAIAEIAPLKVMTENDLCLDYETRLSAVDGFKKEWFASLVYAPLFTRPVILEMMREWVGHALESTTLTKQEFLSYLDTIVMNQIKRLLSKREFPSIMCEEATQEGQRIPFDKHPLLGHVAIYSVNLILLRTIISDEPFVFDENQINTYEDGARPWDRLTHIWRSWFSLDNLNGITAVMLANRRESQIIVKTKEKFQVTEGQNRLDIFQNVSVSLSDNISSGLTGLLLFEPSKDNQLSIEDIAQRLESEKIDLQFQILMKQMIQNESHITSDNAQIFVTDVERMLEMVFQEDKLEELEYIALSLCHVTRRLRLANIDISIQPRKAAKIAMLNSQVALVLCQLAKEVRDPVWSRHFIREFIENLDYQKLNKQNSEVMLTWVQLVKEAGGASYLMWMKRNVFERVFYPREFLELSKHNPEVALAWVQIVKDIKGESLLQQMDTEFLKRAFNPSDFLELSKQNPEVALVWVQIVKEVGGEVLLQQMDTEFLKHAFNPSDFLELSKQNPEVALAWVQIAKEVGEEVFLRWIDIKFFEQVFDLRSFLNLSKQNHKVALTWVQIVKEIGVVSFLQQIDPKFLEQVFVEQVFYLPQFLILNRQSTTVVLAWVQLMKEIGVVSSLQQMDTEFLERTFNPRDFLKLSKKNPEVALAWVQIVKEIGVVSFLQQMDTEFFNRVIYSKKVMELRMWDPKVMMDWIQLAKEIEGESFLQQMDSEFLEREFDRNFLVVSKSPKAALDWMQFMKEVRGKSFPQQIDPKFFAMVFNPLQLLEINKWKPEEAPVWVQFMKEVAKEVLLQGMDLNVFERAFNPFYLLEVDKQNPKVALAWMQLVMDIGGESLLKQHGEEIIDQWSSMFTSIQIFRQKSTSFSVPLRLARIIESPHAINKVLGCLVSSLNQSGREQISLETLPLASLSDLKWLAKETGSPEINSALSLILKE